MDHHKRLFESSQKAFNSRVEKERKWAKNIGLQKVGGKGSQGPFYWIGTQLKAMPFPSDTYDTMDHVDFWEALVDSDVAPKHKITDPEVIRQIKDIPYAFNRGRVAVLPRAKTGGKQFVIYYGEGEQLNDSQKKQIIEAFDLAAQFHAGLVRFVPDEHEARLEDDFQRFSVLTSLPKPKRKQTSIK
jgi:hypothetical protein